MHLSCAADGMLKLHNTFPGGRSIFATPHCYLESIEVCGEEVAPKKTVSLFLNMIELVRLYESDEDRAKQVMTPPQSDDWMKVVAGGRQRDDCSCLLEAMACAGIVRCDDGVYVSECGKFPVIPISTVDTMFLKSERFKLGEVYTVSFQTLEVYAW
jgi:hypothetical protein